MTARARALGLAVAPALAAAAIAIAPRVTVSPGWADAITFAGGSAAALLALAIAATGDLPPRLAAILAGAGAALLAFAAFASPPPRIGAVIVDAALVAIAHAAGGSIGRRVAHPGHLLPACAVAAAADVASVVHPSGPSHAIASSERALALFAIVFPVPGTTAVSPVLGAGDLVFLALIFGVVARHRLSMPRAAIAAAAGVAIAGALSAALGRAVPALVTIGAAVVACVPESRRLRREDRRATGLGVAIAAAALAGALISSRRG